MLYSWGFDLSVGPCIACSVRIYCLKKKVPCFDSCRHYSDEQGVSVTVWICFRKLCAKLCCLHFQDKLYIPWHSKRDLATPLEPLVEYLGRALTPDLHKPMGSSPSPQYILAVQNLAELLRSRKK